MGTFVVTDAGIRQRVRWNAPRNIGLSATVSTRALKVAGVIAVGIAPLDQQILSLAVAELAHALDEGIGKRIVTRRARARARRQKTDAPNRTRRLRPRGKGPCRYRAAEERDELAPFRLKLHPTPMRERTQDI
jgi:hypothetical protein